MDLADKGLAIDLLAALTIALIAPYKYACDTDYRYACDNHENRSPLAGFTGRLMQQL